MPLHGGGGSALVLGAQRSQPLIVMITTAGSDRSGPCYAMQIDVQKMLEAAFTSLEAVNKFSELRLAVLEISGYELKKNGTQALIEKLPA